MVNVIVLFAKIEEAKSIKNLLVRHGINVTQVCTTGAQAAQAADACDDGLIICGYQYPDMLFSELAANIPDYFDILWERKKRKTKPKERTEDEKKVIKAAKLKLMNDNGFDEQGAHRYLQKKSMDNGINIVEMAYMILEHTALF